MAIELSNAQIDAIKQLKVGSVLCGGVGSGKSRTAIGYYFFIDCNGRMSVNGKGHYIPMTRPKDLYIITTAKKRDSGEWAKECAMFGLCEDSESSISNIKVTIDSWNNIKKYVNIKDAFFIFDEQRVVGYGSWSKTFIKIAKSNHWLLLSATPGDQWSDYIPVFIANGFFKNKTDFTNQHCIYSPHVSYPKIDRYYNERILEEYRKMILVNIDEVRKTVRHDIPVIVDYDKELYRTVFRDRWDPYVNEPVSETGKLLYLIRRVVNSDPSRIQKVKEILVDRPRCIIFYNFTYELELLRDVCKDLNRFYAEWNGQKHEECPDSDEWVYLVQYSAGCEGWNCITSNAIIFYSQSYSYRMTEQAMGRIDRRNTPYINLYYYRLMSRSPIDMAINRALRRKHNFNERSFYNEFNRRTKS